MDLFNTLQGLEDDDGERDIIKEPPHSPHLSEKQRLQVMEFMEELKKQRTSDPPAFQKTMESLGLGSLCMTEWVQSTTLLRPLFTNFLFRHSANFCTPESGFQFPVDDSYAFPALRDIYS